MANVSSYSRTGYDANFRKRKASPDSHVVRPFSLDGNFRRHWHGINSSNLRLLTSDYYGSQYSHPYFSDQTNDIGSMVVPPAYQGYEQLSPRSTSALQISKHETALTSDGADLPFLSSSINCGSFAESDYTDIHPSLTSNTLASKLSTPASAQLCINRKSSETLCPLIRGDIDTCQPDSCGPNAACLHFPNLPPVEECAFVPCTTSQLSVNKTFDSEEIVKTQEQPEISAPLSPPLSLTSSAGVPRASSNNMPMTGTALSPSSKPNELVRSRKTDNKSDDSPQSNSSRLTARQAHSLVERKYRENLNAKITQLHEILQASHFGHKDQQQQFLTQIGDIQTPNKVRKSDVLMEAMDYVKNAEEKMKTMTDQIAHMYQVIAELQNSPGLGSGHCENCSLLQGLVDMKLKTMNHR